MRRRNGATFSPCRRYRYNLWRTWECADSTDRGFVMFVGLNPSTADERIDDPTVRRCVGYAKAWGYGALCMTNLFAFRATKPARMLEQRDPVGPHNDRHLVRLARQARLVVAAWGVHGEHLGRAAHVKAILPNLHYLKLTRAGQPGHPLYLRGDLTPLPWEG